MASSRVIGLDIGTSGVRAAEVEFAAGGPSKTKTPRLRRFAQAPLPVGAVRDGEVLQPQIVTRALRDLWSSAGFSSKNVVLGVGNQRVIVRDLEVPAMPLSDVRASLPFQVEEMLPVSAADSLLDFHPMSQVDGPGGRVLRGLLVAAQRETVVPNVEAVEKAGLRPTMVDLNAFALLRALARGELSGRTLAFIDVGASVTNVVIARDGKPDLVRMIPGGGQMVTDAVASALQTSQAEADQAKRALGVGATPQPGYEVAAEAIAAVVRTLVESIRNTFVYHASSHPDSPVEMAVLTGGGTHLPGFGQYLASTTRLPAILGNPVQGFDYAGSLRREAIAGSESLAAVAIGLAYGVAA
jgi:type IV pilus assembly protein PilM